MEGEIDGVNVAEATMVEATTAESRLLKDGCRKLAVERWLPKEWLLKG